MAALYQKDNSFVFLFCFCFFVLFLFFSSKFQNCTPWRNDQNMIVPVFREKKERERIGKITIVTCRYKSRFHSLLYRSLDSPSLELFKVKFINY